MKKRAKTFGIIIGVLLIIVALFYFLTKDKLPKRETLLSEDQAKAVAEANLNLFESWKEPRLDEVFTYFVEEKIPSAYLFTVKDLYGKAGYITVSASTRLKPVLDMSTQPANPTTKALSIRNSLSLGTNYRASDIKMEIYYLGGTEYFAKYTFRESDERNVVYYKVFENHEEISEETFQKKVDYYKKYKEEDVDKLWNRYKIR